MISEKNMMIAIIMNENDYINNNNKNYDDDKCHFHYPNHH